MRVLYASHTATVSGAESSLLEILSRLPQDVTPALACPDGELAAAARTLGIPVVPVPEAQVSLSASARQALAGSRRLASAARRLHGQARRMRADVVHANSTRAGLAAGLARRFGAPPPVVHVHDCLPDTRLARATRLALTRSAVAIVTSSEHAASSFGGPPDRRPRVILSGIDLARFDPARTGRGRERAALGAPETVPLLGVIGQITPWKAQDDAIRVLGQLSTEHHNARLLVVGEPKFIGATSYDNLAFRRHLVDLAHEIGVADRVDFLGQRRDIPQLLSALDVVLVPSWEEPFGLSVVEAMAMGRAVVATSEGGPREIIRAGMDGMLAEPRRPDLWARTISALLSDPVRRSQIERRAQETARRRFSAERMSAQFVDLYREVQSAAPTSRS